MENFKNNLAQIHDIFIERINDDVSVSDIADEFGETNETIIEIGKFYGLDTYFDVGGGGAYFHSTMSAKKKVTNEMLDKLEGISSAVADLIELLKMHR